MKLYYSPGACSLSPHIVLRELSLPFEPVLANIRTHKLADGTDYHDVNPKGYVPLLELDDGERLTEGPAIVQYLADLKPASGLIAAPGTMLRYRQIEWLNFVSTELHKNYAVLFNPAMPEAAKAICSERLRARYRYVDHQLDDCAYLLGKRFSVPDAYLFTVTNWAPHVRLDLSEFKHLQAYMERVAGRAAVHEAMRVEGLLK
jgi:glutathione S-transferase